jgi:hypothetical protein
VKPPDSVPAEMEHEEVVKRPEGVDAKRHMVPK